MFFSMFFSKNTCTLILPSCSQALSTKEMLKFHTKECFKINDKRRIIMPKKDEYVKLRNYERKTILSFIIHADFGSIK